MYFVMAVDLFGEFSIDRFNSYDNAVLVYNRLKSTGWYEVVKIFDSKLNERCFINEKKKA